MGELDDMFKKYHPYHSCGNNLATYIFRVYENEKVVAGYIWRPPPPNAAKTTCKTAPHGVLALVRMVAIPKTDRLLNHISKPLRYQMKHLIDRTRWPVLITYSDESCNHTGHVYKCSGWTKTTRKKTIFCIDEYGNRVSSYSNGGSPNYMIGGYTYLTKWEHWIVSPECVSSYMTENGWIKVPIPNKKWRSGNPTYTYININNQVASKASV